MGPVLIPLNPWPLGLHTTSRLVVDVELHDEGCRSGVRPVKFFLGGMEALNFLGGDY